MDKIYNIGILVHLKDSNSKIDYYIPKNIPIDVLKEVADVLDNIIVEKGKRKKKVKEVQNEQ